MLVLDNTNDLEVTAIVGELCRFIISKKVDVCVLVTSCRGSESLWVGMEPEQRLKLKPLTTEQSMIVLWRWKHNLLPSCFSDDEVRMKLKILHEQDEIEYRALQELAGDVKEYGLGGLPLALAQAGSFACKMRITFSRVVNRHSHVKKAAALPAMASAA